MKELLIKIRAMFSGAGTKEAAVAVDNVGTSADKAKAKLGGFGARLRECVKDSGVMAGAVSAVSAAVINFAGSVIVGAVSSIKSLASAFADGVKGAADFADSTQELGDRIGQSVEDTVLLRQAFDNAGLGSGNLGQAINLLQRAMTGVNEQGQPTAEVFERLGLSINKLREMSAPDQFRAIGQAILGLKDPAEQTRAAMEMFGRSGAGLLTIFKDKNAFAVAAQQVGNLGKHLKLAGAELGFFADALKGVDTKMMTFWVATAAQFSAELEKAGVALNSLDFGRAGEEVGQTLRGVIELAKEIVAVARAFDGLIYSITGVENALLKLNKAALEFGPLGGVVRMVEYLNATGDAAAKADLEVKGLKETANILGHETASRIMDTMRAEAQGIDTSVEGWRNKIQATTGAIYGAGDAAQQSIAQAGDSAAQKIQLTGAQLRAAADQIASAMAQANASGVTPAIQALVMSVREAFGSIIGEFRAATAALQAEQAAQVQQVAAALAAQTAAIEATRAAAQASMDANAQALAAIGEQISGAAQEAATAAQASAGQIGTALGQIGAAIAENNRAVAQGFAALSNRISALAANLQSQINALAARR